MNIINIRARLNPARVHTNYAISKIIIHYNILFKLENFGKLIINNFIIYKSNTQ